MKAEFVAYDCRNHGDTTTEKFNLSIDTLVQDCIDLITAITIGKSHGIVVVGHSMGGAVAAKVAASGKIKNLKGVVVIDVVEGTALGALSSMHSILEQRPTSFKSPEEAIHWSISSGMLNNPESARYSIPSQLQQIDDKWIWKTDLFKTEDHWKGSPLSSYILTIDRMV